MQKTSSKLKLRRSSSKTWLSCRRSSRNLMKVSTNTHPRRPPFSNFRSHFSFAPSRYLLRELLQNRVISAFIELPATIHAKHCHRFHILQQQLLRSIKELKCRCEHVASLASMWLMTSSLHPPTQLKPKNKKKRRTQKSKLRPSHFKKWIKAIISHANKQTWRQKATRQ